MIDPKLLDGLPLDEAVAMAMKADPVPCEFCGDTLTLKHSCRGSVLHDIEVSLLDGGSREVGGWVMDLVKQYRVELTWVDNREFWRASMRYWKQRGHSCFATHVSPAQAVMLCVQLKLKADEKLEDRA